MSDGPDRTVLPIRRPPFAGVAGKTLGGSQPDWGLIGKSVAHVDGGGAKKLKAALADAQAGMGG